MSHKRILFAEHDTLIVEIITPILRRKGYEVNIATDAAMIRGLLSENHPDLVVIDANLPGQDGFQICKMLKADFMTSYIPIIVLIDKKQIRKKILEIEHGIDDYLLKPPDPIELEIRIEIALRRTEHQVRANALTKLPGNKEIERVLRDRIHSGIFSFAYIDIDNFKYFNDAYGYFKGDAAIMQVAHIISTVIKAFGNKDDFVGHIGGDDFAVISTPEKEKLIASKIINEFDRLIIFHYNKEDRLKKFITVRDRTGILRDIPFMSISIAIVNNKKRLIRNIIELTEIAFEIKNYLKSLSGSNYLVNRRSSRKESQRTRSTSKSSLSVPRPSFDSVEKFNACLDKPLGQLLLDEELITEEQLNEALRRHWLTTQCLGRVLVNMKLITQERLEGVLINKPEEILSINPVKVL